MRGTPVLLALLLLAGCDRSIARFPGVSLPFETKPADFVAGRSIAGSLTVEAPADMRTRHLNDTVAGTGWT